LSLAWAAPTLASLRERETRNCSNGARRSLDSSAPAHFRVVASLGNKSATLVHPPEPNFGIRGNITVTCNAERDLRHAPACKSAKMPQLPPSRRPAVARWWSSRRQRFERGRLTAIRRGSGWLLSASSDTPSRDRARESPCRIAINSHVLVGCSHQIAGNIHHNWELAYGKH
jgi:hypothetical protein